jgi:hypothetical protein
MFVYITVCVFVLGLHMGQGKNEHTWHGFKSAVPPWYLHCRLLLYQHINKFKMQGEKLKYSQDTTDSGNGKRHAEKRKLWWGLFSFFSQTKL